MANDPQFDQGLELYHKGRFDEAIGKFENIDNKSQDHGLSLCFIGLCNFKNGNYIRCLSNIDKSIDTFSNEPNQNGFILLEKQYLYFYKFLALLKSDHAEAKQYFERELQNETRCDPSLMPFLWYNKGICLGLNGCYDDCKKYFDNVKSSNIAPVSLKADALRNKSFAEFMHTYIGVHKDPMLFKTLKDNVDYFDNAVKEYPLFYLSKNTLAYVHNLLGNYDESLELVEEIIREESDLAGVYRNKCYSLCMKGKYEDFEEAAICIEEALRLDVKNIYAWNYKGYVLLQLSIADSEKKSQQEKKIHLEESIACFQRAITLDNNYADAWNNKGVALLYLNEDYDTAIGCFIRAIQNNSELTEAHNNLGYAKMRSMNVYDRDILKESLAHFEKALNQKTFSKSVVKADAYRNSGYTNGMLGIYNKAVSDLQAAINILKIPPLNLKQKSDLCDAYRNLGFVNARIAQDLSKKLSIQVNAKANNIPSNLPPDQNKIDNECDDIIKILEKAENDYENALTSDPKYALAHNSYGYFLIHFKVNIYQEINRVCSTPRSINVSKEYEKAKLEFNHAIRIHIDSRARRTRNNDSNISYPYYNRGYVNYLLGMNENRGLYLHKSALDDFNKAIEIDSNFPHAWNNKAVVLNLLGRYGESLETFAIASHFTQQLSLIEEPPDYFASLISKSYALNSLERYTEAILCCRILFDSYEKETEERKEDIKRLYLRHIYYNQGYANFYLKKYKSALECFESGSKYFGSDAEFLFWQGMSQFALTEYGRAQKLFNKIEKLPNNPEDLLVRLKLGQALCQYNLNHYLEARNLFTEILDLYKQKEDHATNRLIIATCHYNLGCISIKENDRTSAKIHFEDCLEENPDFYKATEAIDRTKEHRSHNWFEWWTSHIRNTKLNGKTIRTGRISLFLKSLLLGIGITTIIIGLIYPVYFFVQIIREIKPLDIGYLGLFELAAAISLGLLLSVTMTKFRLAVLEFEAEAPKLPNKILESEPFVEFVQTRMPLQYEITSFRAPIQQPLTVLLRDPLKPLVMPTEYNTLQYQLVIPKKYELSFPRK